MPSTPNPAPNAVHEENRDYRAQHLLVTTPELSECTRLHELEVRQRDSYGLRALVAKEPNLKYIVDIGANVGAFSNFAMELWPNAKIVACEPEAECMKLTRANTGEGRNPNVTYVEAAVIGDPKVKEVKFNVCKWAGNHHVDGRFDMETYYAVGSRIEHQITVPATTLLEIVKNCGFPYIDLLKIDTEGAEPEILQGAKPWLKNVKRIAAEWHRHEDKALIEDALKDTHTLTWEDGAFFDKEGRHSNGNVIAELKV